MYRQAVDVRPQHHCLARLAGIEQRDDTGVSGAGLDLEAELAQSFAKLAARLVLGEAHLGMAVEMPPELDDLIEDRPAWQRRGRVVFSQRRPPGCNREQSRARSSHRGRTPMYRVAASGSAAPNGPSSEPHCCERARRR